jgi:hypothetical protein
VTRTHVLVDDGVAGQYFTQMLCQGCLAGARRAPIRRSMCAPQRAVGSAHPMPTMITLSLTIVLSRSYPGVEGVGNGPEDPRRRTLGIGRTLLCQNHHSSSKQELIPSNTFVSSDPLCPASRPPFICSLASQPPSATKLAPNVEFNNPPVPQPTV